MGNSEIPMRITEAEPVDSVYQRLGGHDSISALIAELYERMFINPYVWYYWKGRSSE